MGFGWKMGNPSNHPTLATKIIAFQPIFCWSLACWWLSLCQETPSKWSKRGIVITAGRAAYQKCSAKHYQRTASSPLRGDSFQCKYTHLCQNPGDSQSFIIVWFCRITLALNRSGIWLCSGPVDPNFKSHMWNVWRIQDGGLCYTMSTTQIISIQHAFLYLL